MFDFWIKYKKFIFDYLLVKGNISKNFYHFRSEQRLSSSEQFYDDEEEEEEILGSDDDEQEDPRDYCKG